MALFKDNQLETADNMTYLLNFLQKQAEMLTDYMYQNDKSLEDFKTQTTAKLKQVNASIDGEIKRAKQETYAALKDTREKLEADIASIQMIATKCENQVDQM